ncbi:MAG: hypothetical protein AABY15_02770 [Nanoarchaeota archaeon]
MSIFPLFARRRKPAPQIIKIEEPKIEPEMPKERTWNAVVKIVLVNNRTDKEYEYTSENDYGLGWEYFSDRKLLCVKQYENEGQDKSHWISQFQDFSIIKVERKKFSSFEIIKEVKE